MKPFVVATMFVVSLSASATIAAIMATTPAAANSAEEWAFEYDCPSPCYTVPVGSSAVDETRLQPYRAVWAQIATGTDGATNPAAFEETLGQDDDGNWHHVQISRPGEAIVTQTRTLKARTLESLSLVRTIENGPAHLPTLTRFTTGHGRIDNEQTLADGTQEDTSYAIGQPNFDGWVAGVIIAALPLEEGYRASLPTTTHSMAANHQLNVEVIGQAEITALNGAVVDAWEVEAEWFDLASGDIYPAGREGSGGTYYIALNPGAGVPHVVEYAAQGFSILWDGNRIE